MLTESQKKEITVIVSNSLDRAEKHWRDGGHELVSLEEATFCEATRKSESSKIPGHLEVEEHKTEIDEFIALVADMRGSSQHLTCAISQKKANVTGLERVFYETSALLPAIEQTILFKDGSVTEYLGDGVLALFRVNKTSRHESIYSSFHVAKSIVGVTRDIVNAELFERYALPNLDVGVGLGLSKSLISLVGLEGKKHPKAFGECIYHASKLSGGTNLVVADKKLREAWPKKDGGTLKFRQKTIKSIKGFVIHGE